MAMFALVGALLGGVFVMPQAGTSQAPPAQAVAMLRAVALDGSAVSSCLDGVADELVLAEPGVWAPGSVSRAESRLPGCDVEAFAASVYAIERPAIRGLDPAESEALLASWGELVTLVGAAEHAVWHLQEDILIPPAADATDTSEGALEDVDATSRRALSFVTQAAAAIEG
jgi:hypothetical protein